MCPSDQSTDVPLIEVNSFFGNMHTTRTPERERLKDIFRKILMRGSGFPDFFAPELCGCDYDDMDRLAAVGSLQIILHHESSTQAHPLWQVILQDKVYNRSSDREASWDSACRVESNTVLAHGLSTRDAFDRALAEYHSIRWNSYRYYYAFHDRPRHTHIAIGGADRPSHPISWMPAFCEQRLNDRSLIDRRTYVLEQLKAQRQAALTQPSPEY